MILTKRSFCDPLQLIDFVRNFGRKFNFVFRRCLDLPLKKSSVQLFLPGEHDCVLFKPKMKPEKLR